MLLWKKLNKLSENPSFDSKFVLRFDIWPFKIVLLFVSIINFSKHYMAEQVKQKHYFFPKEENWNMSAILQCQLVIERNTLKRATFKTFSGLIINSFSHVSRWLGNSIGRGCRGRILLPCTHVGRVRRK